MQPEQLLKSYCPYDILKTSHLTPDNPEFHSFDLNLAILTKYGRYVFIRYGNEEKCSSFFATLATIVNKLEMSFGTQENPAKLKKFKQGILNFYVLKRLNFQYIFWDKKMRPQLQLYSMVEMVHYQLMSCFTSKVNTILQSNQTYDPTINFGKGRSAYNLLQFAIENGLYSLPAQFNAIPILTLTNTIRDKIQSIISHKQFNQDGLQISMLITMNSVIAISKRKTIEIQVRDIFLFFILLQSQSSLSKSANWFPICLPGIVEESMLFCYLNFIQKEIIHIMISDQADIFPRMQEINKDIKSRLESSDLLKIISKSSYKYIINDPSLERTNIMKHFLIRNNTLNQIVMSKGQYFGDNNQFDPNFNVYIKIYNILYQQLLTNKQGKKQKLHIQKLEGYTVGYYDDGGISIFFVISGLCDLEEVKGTISSILKFIKEEESSIFVPKYY